MWRSAPLFLLLACATGMPQSRGDEAQERFERGKKLFEVHDDTGDSLIEAGAEFRRVLELSPRHAAAIAYLGLIAAEAQKPEEAEAAYRKALAIDPDSAEALVGMSRIGLGRGRRPAALEQLRRAVAANPRHVMALRALADALGAENFNPTPEMWREAMRCWRTLVSVNGDDRDAHFALAGAHRRFQQWAEAGREYREVLRIGQTPEDMDVWVYTVRFDLAEMLEKQGRIGEAIQEYLALADLESLGDEERARAKSRLESLEKALN